MTGVAMGQETTEKATPGPWLTVEGEWLIAPKHLLANTADAWLMGSGPELLAACEAAEKVISDMWGANCVGKNGAVLMQLRAAIAKATGEGE